MSRPEVKFRAGSARDSRMTSHGFLNRAHAGDESVLIRQAQAGQREAFAELASHYDRSILGLALRLAGSEQEAVRLYQHALIRAYRELHSYNFRCSFFIWIYTIVGKTCLEFLEHKPASTELNLGQLSARERMVVELKHCFGLKLETIAAILGIPELAARNALVRAMLTLQIASQ